VAAGLAGVVVGWAAVADGAGAGAACAAAIASANGVAANDTAVRRATMDFSEEWVRMISRARFGDEHETGGGGRPRLRTGVGRRLLLDLDVV
jgi:hypothetical protein